MKEVNKKLPPKSFIFQMQEFIFLHDSILDGRWVKKCNTFLFLFLGTRQFLQICKIVFNG